VRVRVGRNPPPGQALWLVEMQEGIAQVLALDALPGLDKDPLAALRRRAEVPALTGLRPVRIESRGAQAIAWNDSSTAVAVMLHSVDNKDRWLVSVDPHTARVRVEHRLTDPAWINWDYNDFGWLPASAEMGDHRLWLLSEQSGYSHLSLVGGNGRNPPRLNMLKACRITC